MSTGLLDTLSGSEKSDSKNYGIVVGIVTNNQDPDKMGRVKVKFPWLSDDQESWWARIATFMAGGKRGGYFLPEVDDEVLVGFEHGDMRFPYILGALWNGKDAPPTTNDDGQNNIREIKSRSGHIIRLDDTSGNEKIEVLDKTGGNSLTIATADNSITITCTGRMKLKAKGIDIISDLDVNIQSQTASTMKAGSTMDIQAQATMNINANATMTIKGALVQIN
jgi:uncharacterized protein involved in type VI secretion and phage assembly